MERASWGAEVQAAPVPDGRLGLVEELLSRSDSAAAAELALRWLQREAGVERGLCAMVDPAHRRLKGLAGLGVHDGEVAGFSLQLADGDHPLVMVLDADEVVEFRESASRTWPPPATPLGRTGFQALPLRPTWQSRGLGLLLLTGDQIDVPEAEWVAGILGARLAAALYEPLSREQARLSKERDWLIDILEAVPDPVLLSDADGRMLLANSDAERLLVADERASEGRRHAVALNNMMFSAALAPGTSRGAGGGRELLLVDPVDGTDLLFELLHTRIQVWDGEAGTVSILRNVTDLHRAIEELEANYRKLRLAEGKTRGERDRLDLILSSVVDPILVTDSTGDIVLMNPPAERLFGADPEEPGAARHVRANDAVLSSFLGNLHAASGERLRGELKLADPSNGQPVPVEAISGKVAAQRGEDGVVVTILHDLTETIEKAMLYEKVKRHSEELETKVREATSELASQNELLRRQALELESASAMKSQFLANVSHELRTPLNAMLNYVSLLLEGVYGGLAEVQEEKLKRVEANAHQLAALVHDVLDISRIEAGKLQVYSEDFDLGKLIEEVMVELEALVDESGLEVGTELAPGTPALHTDRGKVKQVLINFLSNALKFTGEGSVQVRTTYLEDRDHVGIAVSDTGVGISEEEQKFIFEPFGQNTVPADRDNRSTGLGLSICKRLADVLQGSIELESAEGEGSTFKLVIPRRLSVQR